MSLNQSLGLPASAFARTIDLNLALSSSMDFRWAGLLAHSRTCSDRLWPVAPLKRCETLDITPKQAVRAPRLRSNIESLLK